MLDFITMPWRRAKRGTRSGSTESGGMDSGSTDAAGRLPAAASAQESVGGCLRLQGVRIRIQVKRLEAEVASQNIRKASV